MFRTSAVSATLMCSGVVEGNAGERRSPNNPNNIRKLGDGDTVAFLHIGSTAPISQRHLKYVWFTEFAIF